MSIAKAGIITTLNARTSILAAANPVNSKYNPRLPIPANIDLPPTLISRFDLLYLVLDKIDESTDRRLAKHLVSLYLEDRPDTGGQDILVSVRSVWSNTAIHSPSSTLARGDRDGIHHIRSNEDPPCSHGSCVASSRYVLRRDAKGRRRRQNAGTSYHRHHASIGEHDPTFGSSRQDAMVGDRRVAGCQGSLQAD